MHQQLSTRASAIRSMICLLLVAAASLFLFRAGVAAMEMDTDTKMDTKMGGDMKMKMPPTAFPSHSSNIEEEMNLIVDALRMDLVKGEAYGELGGGNGLIFHEMAERNVWGSMYGTGATAAEVAAMRDAVPSAQVFLAQPTKTGLPVGCCDVILMRMVYHMLKAPADYLRDLRSTLKPGGRLLLLEHNSDNGQTGRRGKLTMPMKSGMSMEMGVVPQEAMLVEAMQAGFEVVTDFWSMGIVQPWPYFEDEGHPNERGYAILLKNPE